MPNDVDKRGVFNFLGSIWKAISGNTDSDDDACCGSVIKGVQKSFTTLVIKYFKYTIRKVQIDGWTFNKNLQHTENALKKITDNRNFDESKRKKIKICDQVLESLEEELNDITDSIAFARPKSIYASVMEPK